jgi:hypothetical protein
MLVTEFLRHAQRNNKSQKNDEPGFKLVLRNSQILICANNASTVLEVIWKLFGSQLLIETNQLLLKTTNHSPGVLKMFAVK